MSSLGFTDSPIALAWKKPRVQRAQFLLGTLTKPRVRGTRACKLRRDNHGGDIGSANRLKGSVVRSISCYRQRLEPRDYSALCVAANEAAVVFDCCRNSRGYFYDFAVRLLNAKHMGRVGI